VCHTFAVNRKTSLGEHLAIPLVETVSRGRESADQVRPVGRGTAQCLIPLPAGYGPVMTR
jgi:hypothetical protein